MAVFSNITGNPYVSVGNQTAINQGTGPVSGTISNIVNGAQSPGGSLATSLSGAVTQSGTPMTAAAPGGALSFSELGLNTGTSYTPVFDPFTTSDTTFADSFPMLKIENFQQATTAKYTISYPTDLPKYYMTFKVYNYVRQKPSGNTTSNLKYTIALPLPDGEGITDNTSTQWNDSSLGHWGNALENSSQIKNMIKGFLQSGQNGTISDPSTNDSTKSAFGGDVLIYAADAAARQSSPELAGVAESLFGLAPNPALAMTFKQVDFRRFQFSWLLSARNKEETDIIKNIVVALKQAQLPNFTKGSSIIFQYPNIVVPTFVPNQDYMTDFKPCVITAVNVKYSPVSKAPSFYANSAAPVFVELSIALEEMQIRLPGDYKSTDKASAASAKESQGQQTASQIVGIPSAAPTPPPPPQTNHKPTDPGAAAAQTPSAGKLTVVPSTDGSTQTVIANGKIIGNIIHYANGSSSLIVTE